MPRVCTNIMTGKMPLKYFSPQLNSNFLKWFMIEGETPPPLIQVGGKKDTSK